MEFVVNNRIYLATKIFLFIAYRRELKIRVVIRRKEKREKAIEIMKGIKKV